jgi:hypothetical protein
MGTKTSVTDKSALRNVPEDQRSRVHFLPHITDTASLLPTVHGRRRSRILQAVFILSIKNIITPDVGKSGDTPKVIGVGNTETTML